ncbi:hypothetical protein [Candidatus Mycoplasma haematohominis]|uniref:hypothetical protein n=1 Tax=Candidatus Mycoplasma haematohominis TaxID=1494318 RepID=UPI001C0A705E|nr:hypothetical protein [Candidatus Mycoplasma haemohominis]
MDPTKLAVGAGTAVLIAGGGYGVSTLFQGGMPDYVSFSTTTSALYVFDSPDYFVDIDHKDSSSWWTWVYNTRYWVDSDNKTAEKETRPTPKRGFENLKDAEGIKATCKAVYAAAKEKVKSTGEPSTNEYFEADVWRYCTAVKKKPIVVGSTFKPGSTSEKEDSEYSNGTFGKANKDKLVSITAKDNDSFWQEQQRLFFKKQGNRSGASLKNNSAFQDLYENWKSGKSIKDDALKSLCQESYGKVEATTSSQSPNKYPKEDVFKFCSLKGSSN